MRINRLQVTRKPRTLLPRHRTPIPRDVGESRPQGLSPASERVESLLTGIREIHKARVEHSDIHPRNMMIVEDDPARSVMD
ncbi:hypothetical protein BO70DRAFT_176671 [Aspergillus heteromorphus CBS 117.55]|uniref:Protein kinase domain-containing protein n=1 Tax=Aspergillus heteromorphus CBS 117.55 TaxID=1448321 RepID=A0A317V0M2_9EURO|nr:uncharacterized protein BO70DRAFT_176671 [Aspergillus heteromorphus CBS 117.55]PWY65720.1 hypothetical protein BO70DRAFT_176671 [Aspergillus heteromorphus CBS 117.55]